MTTFLSLGMPRFVQKSFVALLGIFTLLTLLGLSIYFYRERIYFSDPAYQLFLMINDGRIEIMTNRWPSVIFRILPYLGMQAGVSLATLSQLFSVSFPLYHLLAFCICHFLLKDRLMAMLILFATVIATSETFYWCSSDLLQGIVTFIIGISLYRSLVHYLIRYSIGAFLMVAAVFFHPLCLFPFFFIIIDDILENKKIHLPDIFLPLVFGISWIIRNQFFTTWYDTAKSAEFWGNYKGLNIWKLPAHKIFLTELPIFYNLLLLLLIVNFIIYIKNKNWLRPVFIVLSILTYTLIIHIGNPYGAQPFYREASYISLAIFISYPFLKNAFKTDAVKLKYLIVIPLLIAISLFRIYKSAEPYTQRIQYLYDNLAIAKCSKSIFTPSDKVDLKMDWAIPFETALLSSESGKSSTLFNTKKPKDFLKKERRDAFLSSFKVLYTSDFNAAYFDFEDINYCLTEKAD